MKRVFYYNIREKIFIYNNKRAIFIKIKIDVKTLSASDNFQILNFNPGKN